MSYAIILCKYNQLFPTIDTKQIDKFVMKLSFKFLFKKHYNIIIVIAY